MRADLRATPRDREWPRVLCVFPSKCRGLTFGPAEPRASKGRRSMQCVHPVRFLLTQQPPRIFLDHLRDHIYRASALWLFMRDAPIEEAISCPSRRKAALRRSHIQRRSARPVTDLRWRASSPQFAFPKRLSSPSLRNQLIVTLAG